MFEQKLIQVIASVLVGAVPFIVGGLRGRLGLGLAGMFATVICNKLGGLLLSIPFCAVFVVFLVRRSGPGSGGNADTEASDKDQPDARTHD